MERKEDVFIPFLSLRQPKKERMAWQLLPRWDLGIGYAAQRTVNLRSLTGTTLCVASVFDGSPLQLDIDG